MYGGANAMKGQSTTIIIKTNGWNLQYMIKVVKLFSYCQNFGGYLPCPWALYMYKIVKSLNFFFSEIAWTVFTRFHMGPSVEFKDFDN